MLSTLCINALRKYFAPKRYVQYLFLLVNNCQFTPKLSHVQSLFHVEFMFTFCGIFIDVLIQINCMCTKPVCLFKYEMKYSFSLLKAKDVFINC